MLTHPQRYRDPALLFITLRVLNIHARNSLSPIGDSYPRSHNFYDIYRDKEYNRIRITDCSFFDYDGDVNTTKDGIPCKKWKDVKGIDLR